jgi:hypothetical protein
MAIVEDNQRMILQPLTPEFIDSLCGWLKGSRALEYLLEERKKDREL